MIDNKQADYLAPAVADRIVTYNNDSSIPPIVIIENRDAAASASVKIQESDDGSTWTDVAGTTNTINPLSSVMIQAASIRRLLAIHAGGDVPLNVQLTRVLNGVSPLSFGSIC